MKLPLQATRLRIPVRLLIVIFAIGTGTGALAQEFEGFTEPVETVHVASDESGVIQELLVSEGESITAGQPIARLDNSLQAAQLAIATQNKLTQGHVQAAEADLRMRKVRLEKLQMLLEAGHARQEEVTLARTEYDIALANLMTAREEVRRRELEFERSQVLFNRRTIQAPATGIITDVAKRAGEFVAPNNPELVTIVRIDELIANFSMIYQDAKELAEGREVQIEFLPGGERAIGRIIYVAPITDAESGTTRVKVLIPNDEFQFRSGGRCRMSY